MAKMSSTALSKMLLHAAKYPHLSVNGVLLGKKSKGSESGTLIVDCIPLFHLNLTLLPMLEVALTQVEAHCQEEDIFICGYYHIDASLDETKLSVFMRKMMEKLIENCGEKVLLFMVDNRKLNSKEIPFSTYEYKENTGELIPSERVSLESGALEFSMKLVKNGDHDNLVDFDNHFDDVSLDWRNPNLIDH